MQFLSRQNMVRGIVVTLLLVLCGCGATGMDGGNTYRAHNTNSTSFKLTDKLDQQLPNSSFQTVMQDKSILIVGQVPTSDDIDTATDIILMKYVDSPIYQYVSVAPASTAEQIQKDATTESQVINLIKTLNIQGIKSITSQSQVYLLVSVKVSDAALENIAEKINQIQNVNKLTVVRETSSH